MKGKKVALVFITLNEPYWQYLKNVIDDCNKYFLTDRTKNHKVDFFLWTDMPEGEIPNTTVFPTEPMPWPLPTLMRYHLFLQQEEILKKYDYIFYMDTDMRVVSYVGDEILGQGLTAAPHPGYAIRKEYLPPYEPNPESEAYIPRLGHIVDDGGKPRFMPFYAAGGFQGGTSKEFIKAMKAMKANIDRDSMMKNYTAIWNDESHWNKYLWNYKGPITYLDVSYIYPDSLIKEYYEPLWGRSYDPKIITLTKPFSLKTLTAEDRQRLGIPATAAVPLPCPTCGVVLQQAGHQIERVITCNGADKPHEVQMKPV